MARDEAKRAASRKAQNLRRKIERRMSKIISEVTGQKVSGKQAVEMYERGDVGGSQLKSLYGTREVLKAEKGKSGYSGNISQIAESVEAFTEIRFGQTLLNKKGTSDKFRRNKMFERNINQSTAKNGLSALSREDTKAFYAGTRDLWSGQSTASNRNATIMQQFGVTDLEIVYNLLVDDELISSEKELKKLVKEYKSSKTSEDRINDINDLMRKYGFSDIDLFSDWLNEIDSKSNLFKRREIILDELEDIRNAQKTGGNTDDEAYNGPNEKTAETSPEYSNRIISRIARALNGY